MAESVAQSPNVRHLSHLENKLSIPGTLTYCEFLRIPQTTIVRCCEITCKWIDVISVTGLVTNCILKFEQRHPFFKIGKNNFCWSRWSHFLVLSITVSKRIRKGSYDLNSSGITWSKSNFRPRNHKFVHILNCTTSKARTTA